MTNYIAPKDLMNKQILNLRALSKELKIWHYQLKHDDKFRTQFNMITYNLDDLDPCQIAAQDLEVRCGTTCCALGYAAIKDIGDPKQYNDFHNYSFKEFIGINRDLFHFLFGNQWSLDYESTDTPLNVALRIDHFLSEDFRIKEYSFEGKLRKDWYNYIGPFYERYEQEYAENYDHDVQHQSSN